MTQRAMLDLLRLRGIRDPRVLAAMEAVPRHRFVPEAQQNAAYGDYPLPIGYQQTISQPYIVALMTEALELTPGERVLEIGTGSGYQAAVLAEMGMEVYTIERVPELATSAQRLLEELGYTVHCRAGDGYHGWEAYAPFDAIIVTAAATEIPEPLVDQLREGGRMVIPLGPQHGYQTLWKIHKKGGSLHKTNLGGVAFVPFVHS